ncbi:uncharacterized protein LY89DRAFT_665042 [Mollisia scopiformis]|uniref:Uncharacterized protein n=1 Tax=Mollisia scopiformis TaxID=149040 RepID=A0A194XNX3_MOLSC|nr:uncharacterized protein LY89DRAFT_665042 [Mollisia scopiformis]KUJ21883.1 hypothetical protein LY89DRAFT_665042 [Mollisia scopiformis]
MVMGELVQRAETWLYRGIAPSLGTQPPIAWMDVQRFLESAPGFDVLLLMDCCYAARTIKGFNNKAMEVLAADPSLEEQSPNHIIIMGHRNPIVLKPLGPAQSGSDAICDDDPNGHPPEDDSGSEDSDTWPAITLGIQKPRVRNPWTRSVEIIDVHEKRHNVTVLLDTSASCSFIKFSTVHRLDLEVFPRRPQDVWVFQSFDGSQSLSQSYTTIKISKTDGTGSLGPFSLFVLPTETDDSLDVDVSWGGVDISTAGLLNPHFEMLHNAVEERIQAEENSNQEGAETENSDAVLSEELVKQIGQMRQLVQEELARRAATEQD